MKISLFSGDMKDHERQDLCMLHSMFRHIVAVATAAVLVVLSCTTACRHADTPSGKPDDFSIEGFLEPPPIDVTALTRTNQTEIVIANRVTKIGCNAFSNYKDVTSIFIPASVTEIQNNAFEGCTSQTNLLVDSENTIFSSKNGVLFNKEQTRLILCPNGMSGSYTIPDGVTEIESCAFKACTSLTSITIPEGPTHIGSSAFSGCTRLKSIAISSSVVDINSNAFHDCTDMTNVLVSADNAKFSSADGALFNKDRTRLILCPKGKSGTYTLPAEVTKIEPGALGDCTGLTNILVDANNAAFSSVDGVLFDKDRTTLILCPRGRSGSYTIPAGVTEIGNGAFRDCVKLTSVTIPEGVTKIGSYAFSYCRYLNGIRIPNSVNAIGEGAFWGCQWLKTATLPKGITTVEKLTFSACISLESITIPEGVTRIGELAFYSCGSMMNITIPASLTEIGDRAFYDCAAMTDFVASGSIDRIGSFAFSGCSGLTNFTTSGSIDRIGFGAFSGCTGLTSIPKGVTDYFGPLIPQRDRPGRNRPL